MFFLALSLLTTLLSLSLLEQSEARPQQQPVDNVPYTGHWIRLDDGSTYQSCYPLPRAGGPRELPNPRGGQILKAIFWGRGMKRWHCGSGYVVAHIDLYDITNLPSDVLDHALDGGVAIDQTPLPSSAIFGYGRIENTYKIPLVEFTQTDGSSFFRGRKPRNLEVLAPETQVRGTDNEEAMDWEIYRAADNTKTIYQVNTVGGAEPPECHSKFGQEIEVYFTAQYWVYDSHSSPGITRDQQPEDVCRFKTTYDAPVTNDWQVVGANL